MKIIFITKLVSQAALAVALLLCLMIPANVLAQGEPGLYTPDGGWGKQGGDNTPNNQPQQPQQDQGGGWQDFNPNPPPPPQQNPGPPMDAKTGEPTWTGVDSNTTYADGSRFVVHYYKDEFGRLNRNMATIDKDGKTQQKSECQLPTGQIQNTTKPVSGSQSNTGINIQGPKVDDFMSKPQQSAPTGPGGAAAAPRATPFFGGRGK